MPETAAVTLGVPSHADPARPFAGLQARAVLVAAYVALLPVQLPLGSDRRLALSDLCVLAYLALTAGRLRRLHGAWTVWTPALVAVMGMGLLVALVRTGAIDEFAITQKAVGLLFLIVSMAVLLDFLTTLERLRWVLGVYVAGVTVNAALALAVFAVQQSDRSLLPSVNFLGARLAGLAIDPNAFGGFVASALMLHLVGARLLLPSLSGLLVRSAVAGVLSVALVLTFSRSAWIGAVAGLTVALAALGAPVLRAAAPVLITLGVGVPLLTLRYLPDLVELARRPAQVDDRLSIVATSLSDFAEAPLLGTGLGTYEQRHGVIIHNTLLWFLTELGLIGLLVILGLLVSTATRLLRLVRNGTSEVRPLAAALLAAHAAMVGLSLGIEALYQREWWLLFAAAAALRAAVPPDRR